MKTSHASIQVLHRLSEEDTKYMTVNRLRYGKLQCLLDSVHVSHYTAKMLP